MPAPRDSPGLVPNKFYAPTQSQTVINGGGSRIVLHTSLGKIGSNSRNCANSPNSIRRNQRSWYCFLPFRRQRSDLQDQEGARSRPDLLRRHFPDRRIIGPDVCTQGTGARWNAFRTICRLASAERWRVRGIRYGTLTSSSVTPSLRNLSNSPARRAFISFSGERTRCKSESRRSRIRCVAIRTV